MLRVDGLHKTFNSGSPDERKALCGIDLALESGEFAIVIGSNGAGKSTLLNAVAGDFQPDSGTIRIGEADVTSLPAHRRSRHVARVFQDPSKGTAPGMSVAENLALAECRGKIRTLGQALSARNRDRFRAALAPLGLGLENRLDAQVQLLSGGQRQALSLVMAVLVPPDILILDEHCAALDPRTAAIVMEATLRSVREARITTLMVTHNMAHAIQTGDRLVMMHEGRILFQAAGTEKAALTVDTLVNRFHLAHDELLLTA